jgi:hypothetical protein
MIRQSPDKSVAKGWFVGPWNSAVPVPVGYANEGVNEPHKHAQMFEIYLVARGTSTAVVNQQPIRLQAGDMLIVEPGETHTSATVQMTISTSSSKHRLFPAIKSKKMTKNRTLILLISLIRVICVLLRQE